MTLQVKGSEGWDLLHSNLKLSLLDWSQKMKQNFTDGGKDDGKASLFYHFLRSGPFRHKLGPSRPLVAG